MKRSLTFVLGISLLLLSCSLPGATLTPSPPVVGDPFQTAWDDRSIFREGLVASRQPVLGELQGASVYHLELEILDSLYEIKGAEEVRYTNTEDVPLREVQFRLFPNILGGEMTVHSLAVDGQPVEPRYGLENSLMIVPLPGELPQGQSIVIKVDFFVAIPQHVERNYGVQAYFDDVLALAHAYPMIAVYDDEGWIAEIPPPDGDLTYADAAFFLVKVRAPAGLTLVASGRTINRSEAGATQILTVASGPARDFFLAASPDFQETSKTAGEVTIRSYAPGNVQEGSQMAAEVAARAIADFSARYTPYPYTELDIVATPTRALGIEYPGVIAIASRIYDVERLYRGTPASVYMECTVAHEVGHQWFYNLVGDDQLDDPWLDESLTQFATLQYYADEYGPSGEQGFRNSLEARWKGIDLAEIPIGLPVAAYQAGEYGGIVYGRGALFFVALREQMGQESFDAFLKEYAQTLSWGIATPERLQSLAEEHCACELDAIFEEWVYP